MNIANLSALFLLSLIPIVILLHSIRTRRRDVRVSSLFFWERVLREKKASFRIKKIIRNIPLILQILAILAMIFSLARPFLIRDASHGENNIILVLDKTASMKAEGNGGNRFKEAKSVALDIVDGMKKKSKMIIIEAGAKPRLLTSFSGNKDKLKDLIRKSEASDEPGDIRDALLMALSFADRNRGDEIMLISDGAYDGIDDIDFGKAKVKFFKMGGGSRNVGITKFQFRRLINYPDRYEIMVSVGNFNAELSQTKVKLFIDRHVILEKDLQLNPHEEKTLVFPYSGLIAGNARAEIDVNDDFKVDNTAYAVLSQSKQIWVLLITKGNFFLESLLAAYPNVMVNKLSEVVASSFDQQVQGHDIVIFDGIEPPPLKYGNFLLVNSLAPNLPIKPLGLVENPIVLNWERTHPVMNSLNIGDLNIAQAIKTVGGDGAKSLLRSEDTSLMYAYERGGLRLIYIGFDLLKSDLPLRVAFPIMMGNIFNWLYPDRLSFSSQQVQAGSPYPIYFKSGVSQLKLIKPDGESETLQVQENPYVYEKTSKVGFYTVEIGDDEMDFAVNLSSKSESDIAPRYQFYSPEEELEKDEVKSITIGKVEKPLWAYFALLAAMVIIGEWYFWSRERG